MTGLFFFWGGGGVVIFLLGGGWSVLVCSFVFLGGFRVSERQKKAIVLQFYRVWDLFAPKDPSFRCFFWLLSLLLVLLHVIMFIIVLNIFLLLLLLLIPLIIPSSFFHFSIFIFFLPLLISLASFFPSQSFFLPLLCVFFLFVFELDSFQIHSSNLPSLSRFFCFLVFFSSCVCVLFLLFLKHVFVPVRGCNITFFVCKPVFSKMWRVTVVWFAYFCLSSSAFLCNTTYVVVSETFEKSKVW